jgi:hypothetical protein
MKSFITATALMSTILLLAAVYLFIKRVQFLSQAQVFDAPIVAVPREYVRKGKGSVLAYVPQVAVADHRGATIKLKVDTYNEAPVYSVGSVIRVSCNPQIGCIEDTFWAKWADCGIDLALSLLFLSPLVYYKFSRRTHGRKRELLYSTPDA